jgi:hypothetical protein
MAPERLCVERRTADAAPSGQHDRRGRSASTRVLISHDFRPDYLRIGDLRFLDVPLAAFTATADEENPR